MCIPSRRVVAGCFPLVLFTLLSSSMPAKAWGRRAHEMVNAAAVENLPEPFRTYFRARKTYLIDHAIDPDLLARQNPEQHRHHFTEVEGYDRYPFFAFQREFVDLRRGPSPSQLSYGDSVWQIEAWTGRLAGDFRARRWEDADHAAVFAAHYACDLTQPLHTVLNYDGQFTRQAGIHARFETDLVNALWPDWSLKPLPARDEPDLRTRIFFELLESYRARNIIFASDRIAVSGRNYLDTRYFATFAQLAGPLAEKRLTSAVSFVSSLWYTAWVRAGKPSLENWTAPREVPAAFQASPD